MTVRMTFPPFVTRAAIRIMLGGLVAAAAIAVAALVIERTQLGGDLAASRARLRAEVEGEFAALANRLDQAVRAVTLDVETLRRAERGDAGAQRQLFDQVAASAARTGVAVTIYGAANQPVAWLGRSENVPDARLSGPSSSFLSQSSQGLQLVRVEPILDPADPTNRIGAIVAETELPRIGSPSLQGSEFSIETSIVPVALRLQFEGASDAGPDAFVIRSTTDEPLAAVTVSDVDLQRARQRIRDRLLAAELALAGVLLLLLTGALLDWRRITKSALAATAITFSIALLLLGARAIFWVAIRKAGVAEFSLLPEAPWSRFASIAFASPLDFFLNALVVAGLVTLAVSSFEMWRAAHRPGIGAVIVDRPGRGALFYIVQLGAGLAVAALVMSYEWLLRTHVSQTPVDILRFALDRLDLTRLPVLVGLIALNAAVVGLAILLYRLAWSPWVFASRAGAWRVRGFRSLGVAVGDFLRRTRRRRSRAAVAVAAGRPVCGGGGVADASLRRARTQRLAGDAIAAVVSRCRAALAGAVSLARGRVGAGATAADRIALRAGSDEPAAGSSYQAPEGPDRDQSHRRAR